VAEVLIEQARGNRTVNISASTIAQHLQLAGELGHAAEYFRLAGENARSLFAHREAVANFRAALTYGLPQESELHEAIGDSLTMLGDYHAASESYEAAIAFCQPEVMPGLELKLGNIHHRLGEYELAMCYFQASASALQENNDPSLLARVYADWSRSAFFLHDPEKARQLASQALIQAEKAGDPWAIAQVQNILGILARHADQFDIAEIHLKRSLQVANQLQESVLILAALNNLALLNVRQGDLEEATKNIELALEHCERVGDRHLEAALHNNLADIFHNLGETDQAMQELKKAAVIFAEIGLQEGEIVPEVWKLTEW
jgi:tetratricopeptide (TPR) repeat protein